MQQPLSVETTRPLGPAFFFSKQPHGSCPQWTCILCKEGVFNNRLATELHKTKVFQLW